MYHYIGFLWNPIDSDACAAASHLAQRSGTAHPRWNVTFSAAGLRVVSAPFPTLALREYALPNDSGVVLGRLFPAALGDWHPDWEPAFDERRTRRLVSSGGRNLVEEYWGSYICFLREENGSRRLVLRDCSGKFPAYRTQYERVHMVFADIEDLDPLRLPPFSIDKRYLAAFIHSSQLQIRQCALSEVTELLAGECLEFSSTTVRQFPLWDPRVICTRNSLDNREVAIEALRTTTQKCVDAWASTYKSIVHSLSGGFDSSVVLGCLQRSPRRPTITSLNQFSEFRSGDERRYARLAATRAGSPLLERQRATAGGTLDSRLLEGPRVPKPTVQLLFTLVDSDATNQVSRDLRAEAIWTGQGGDHLFLQMHNGLAAADYLAEHGYHFGFLKALLVALHVNLDKMPELRRETVTA